MNFWSQSERTTLAGNLTDQKSGAVAYARRVMS
jgi:hypothetical protein